VRIDLTGRTALVTGSTAGIGHAIAVGLAGAGAAVVVNGRTVERVREAVDAISRTASSEVRGAAFDVGIRRGVPRPHRE